MANIKFFILLVLAAAIVIFRFPSEALVCKCKEPWAGCVNGEQTCENGSTECYKSTNIFIPEYGGRVFIIEACNFAPPIGIKLPPEGNDGTCRASDSPTNTLDFCFCNTDLCIPPEPNRPPKPPTPTPPPDDGTTPLVCKCTPSPQPGNYYDCIDGEQICWPGTKECLKTTLNQGGRPPQIILTCNENELAQPVTPGGKCETTTNAVKLTRENCFCDTDMCDAGVDGLVRTTSPGRPGATTPAGNAKGNAIVLHSYSSWSYISIPMTISISFAIQM